MHQKMKQKPEKCIAFFSFNFLLLRFLGHGHFYQWDWSSPFFFSLRFDQSIVFAAPNFVSVSHTNKESESNEEQEQAFVARVLSNFRPKDGNKPFRQKDQQQLRRRVTLGYKENSSASSGNTLHYQQSRCLDLLSDVSSVYPAQPHRQQNHFLASHPTGSRINLF